MSQIFEIDSERRTPKYLQIINSVTKSIKLGRLKKGDKILSINELSIAFYLSRATVQKAYDILEDQGVILPVRGKGFYINRADTTGSYQVLLLFNKISSYKQLVYNSFVKHFDPNAIIDLKIHHGNAKIFEKLIETHISDYDYFVVMPHFYDNVEEGRKIIKRIPREKLIIVDKELDESFGMYPSVCQDFKNDIIAALESGLQLINKYERIVFVFPEFVPYPREICMGFKKFCIQHNIAYEIISEVSDRKQIKRDEAYIVIEDTDLVNLIKKCKLQQLEIGKDIGIISYNDTILKEILHNGITVISTDHALMGQTAASLIMNNKKENVHNEFNLIVRNSL